MEARRLSVLCSQICPGPTPAPAPAPTRLFPVSSSSCNSGFSNKQQPGDSNKGNLQNGCVFCRIIRGESPAFKLYEDDICLCILDTNPESWVRACSLSYGMRFVASHDHRTILHSVIIPKSHFCSLKATPPDVVAAMCSKVPFISSAIMKATDSDSFNLLVNNGAAAGQVIFHTHMRIIPRKVLDCLWASESLQRRPLNLDQEAPPLVDRVREQLSLSDDSEDSKGEGSSLTGN